MRMSFDVQTPDMTQNREQIDYGSKLVLWKAMTKMEEIAKYKAPVGMSGLLKARINLSPLTFGATEYTLSDGVYYGIYVEFGTRPHWAPIEPLKDWARRVLGDEDAAYPVQKKIAKKGTPFQPFFRPAVFEVNFIWLPYFKKEVFGSATV